MPMRILLYCSRIQTDIWDAPSGGRNASRPSIFEWCHNNGSIESDKQLCR